MVIIVIVVINSEVLDNLDIAFEKSVQSNN